jgi:hypothetical protein
VTELGVFKSLWTGNFFGAGVATTTGQATQCGRFTEAWCRAYTDAAADGVVTAESSALMAASSPASIADRITVTTASGAKLVYRVTARETIKKSKLPLDNLFAITGPPRLTLISCAGYYSKDNGGYQDNIVITAVPAGTATAVPSTS